MDRAVGGAKWLQSWGLLFIALFSSAVAGCQRRAADHEPPPRHDDKRTAVTANARAEAVGIFGERCAVCHGADGDGAGPASESLNPKPPNFHNRRWQESVSDERMAKAIVDGGASVGLSPAMASNPDLQGRPDVVAALVEHIRRQARAK